MSSIPSQSVVKSPETRYVESEREKLVLKFDYLRKKLQLWRLALRVAEHWLYVEERMQYKLCSP
jgi:hypothetical protein